MRSTRKETEAPTEVGMEKARLKRAIPKRTTAIPVVQVISGSNPKKESQIRYQLGFNTAAIELEKEMSEIDTELFKVKAILAE